jgi:urea carboxylase
VAANRYMPKVREVTFDLDEFNKDIDGYNARLEGVLNGH